MFDWLAPLQLPVVQRAVITLLVAGATLSLLGVFIVTLQLTALRFSLLHVGLLGSSVALVAGADPLLGGILAMVAASLGLGPLADRLKLAPSSVSAFLMTGSLAAAFILFYKAGVPAMEVFALFAGNVLTVRPAEAWFTAGLGGVICLAAVLAYRELQAVLYHRELATALGVPARLVWYGILGLTGAAVAVAIRLVGALLVDALLLLPAMAALPLARSLAGAFVLTSTFGLLAALAGAAASLAFDWPIGASVGAAGVLVLALSQLVLRPLLGR